MQDSEQKVFPRKLDGDLPVAAKSEGVWIEDTAGKRYLDASGGAVVVNLGHGRPEITRAVTAQLESGSYFHPTMFTTRPVEELAAKLASHAPEGLDRFYFLSGGGEAVEAAIKLARQIQLAKGRPERIRLISRWKSYHGLSMGALSAMGRTVFRKPFAPMLTEVEHIAPPYCLRCFYGLKPESCGLRCALALEDTIINVGPELVTGFLAETVSGATLAAYPPPKGYWKLIREICDKYQVLMIQDEVMAGMGRTGRWFASEHYDVIPDIVTLGKGLSGGALPLSAVGIRGEHFNVLKEAGGFTHGGTFSHHPVAAAAGLAAVGIMEDEKLVQRAAELGDYLGDTLKARLGGHGHVADVRGIGMLWGVELVEDKTSLKPYPRSEKVIERVWRHLFDDGVIAYKAAGLAGIDGDALVISPPFIITRDEISMVVDKVAEALDAVLG